MPFQLQDALLTTYRPLSHLTLAWPLSIISAAQASWPAMRADAVPEPHEPKHFARSRRDILIGAGDGMLPCVGDRLRSRAKILRFEVFGAEARATGAGQVFWTRS